jgi:hypothetical protein
MAHGTKEVYNEIFKIWVSQSWGEDVDKLPREKMLIVYKPDDKFPNLEEVEFEGHKSEIAHSLIPNLSKPNAGNAV